jgi:hypothetical protein
VTGPVADEYRPSGPDAVVNETDVDGGIDAGSAAAGESQPAYVVSLALQRGPYPYEQRTIVVAVLDAATEAEGYPEEWQKAIRRALKEGGEVRVVRIGLDPSRLASVFDTWTDSRTPRSGPSYAVRIALTQEQPPVVVAAVDQEMAESMGLDLAGPLGVMPMFYRRRTAKALGELREILVAVPRVAVDEAFAPRSVPAEIERLLALDDPRF